MTTVDHVLADLNPPQREAVTTVDGALLILAALLPPTEAVFAFVFILALIFVLLLYGILEVIKFLHRP